MTNYGSKIRQTALAVSLAALAAGTNYGSIGAVANGTYYHSSSLQEPGVLTGGPLLFPAGVCAVPKQFNRTQNRPVK